MSSKSCRPFFRITSLLCIMAVLLSCGTAVPAIAAETEEPVHILLIGQDRREEDIAARADSILLCTIHPDSGEILMTSFLRDLFVPIPGYPDNRLNAAYAHGGMALLRQTLEETFSVPIDGCVEVDFSQFAQILDILGGVTIDLRQDEAQVINQAVPGALSEGSQLLNGEQALAYTRIRNLDDNGDFSRTLRQRKVLSALLGSYRNASLFTVLSIVPQILPMLSTDMEKKQIVAIVLQLLPMLSSCAVSSQTVPAEGEYTDSTIRGMAVLTADLEAVRRSLAQSLSGKNTSFPE